MKTVACENGQHASRVFL